MEFPEYLPFWDKLTAEQQQRISNIIESRTVTKGTHIHSDMTYPDGAYLVFGKETAGLPEWLLHDHPDACVRLPMIANDAARSLNLSNTVAVGVYEVLRQWGYPALRTEGHLTQY